MLEIRESIRSCHRCSVREAYDSPVLCAGSVTASVMFIGEAPGADEVEQGKPFVGMSGRMLRSAIEDAGLSTDDVFITNTICCRPFGNKFPTDAGPIECCIENHMFDQIEFLRPRIIVSVGGQAHKHVRGSTVGITKACGEWEDWEVIPDEWTVRYLPTLHPSFCMKGPDDRYDNPVMKLSSPERVELFRAHIASIKDELEELR